ncbi:prepilin-type N-terminal cleavage/methylation domain-containing protein [bacterium]|jgi:prepilin-type N-terminal cleavage/methylation domain-containing protein|nr:prepilin-type N-terminal cleavage/methylation domain-containing protein [bacterium]MBT6831773.1 prepilin-type N-terminal cleavage/methylation domain-containing protein [bacterium]MBT6996596.1 prepilin-type N-terminal cleavage/methylation domain-containing protein [bacterium]MBT7772922.1 prepilin-type N-terminal cleavage/methylation domain-containing protein [bacterium]
MRNTRKNSGFTLVEIIIASAIAAIVLSIAFGTIGTIYFSQKKINISQDFYDETRVLMERLAQLGRNNTIDYDRFFDEVGPDGSCSNSVSYPEIFYADTDGDGELDRNLGGTDENGDDDPCTVAFFETGNILFLINGDRTVQTAIQWDSTNFQIEVQRRIGFDETENDGIADEWYESPPANCETSGNDPLGGTELCSLAHDWTAISPPGIKIENFEFLPSPDRDPFLAFRIDSAQIHPNIFFSLETSLVDFEKSGFDTAPEMLLQSVVSSRVFGNTHR